nr:SMR family transporter [Klebsiella pneumoniae]
MQQFEWIHAAWLAIAIVLEIIANVFLKFSDGFRRKIYGILSLAAVWARSAPCRRRLKDRSLGRLCAVGRLRYRGDHRRRLGAVWSASE